MSRLPTTSEFKIQICEKYLSGEATYQGLASEHGVKHEILRRWMDERERLRRENRRLKRHLKESNMLNELLKK